MKIVARSVVFIVFGALCIVASILMYSMEAPKNGTLFLVFGIMMILGGIFPTFFERRDQLVAKGLSKLSAKPQPPSTDVPPRERTEAPTIQSWWRDRTSNSPLRHVPPARESAEEDWHNLDASNHN